ncbi:MAG TPA: Gfo/Idh/MocA family oxidoreductase [Pyrinomonadaceae bacterium]|nr:Gfo/Idh/MocA family oxidoreductase [Pyrinomonadaceae bacterium]
MIRIAIAGCGEHSRASHAAPLARYAAAHPNEIELVAACDLNVDKAVEFCRSFGFVRPYQNLDQMLDVEQLDACVAVMPMEKIVEVGIKLLERRLACVIEKPLGTSLTEIERLAQVARDTQTPHMVSVNRRFMPYLNQARSWMHDHGPLRYVRASQVRHGRNEPDFIWSTAIHALDALRYIAGEIAAFDVTVPPSGKHETAWYVIALRFESGTIGRIEVLPTGGMVEESYELFAEGCRARVTAGSGPQRSLQCWKDDKLVLESQATEDQPEDLRNGAYQEVEEFVRSLRTGARPRPCIDDILPSARISFAIADLVRGSQT